MGVSFVLRITSSEVHNLLHTRSLCNSTDIVEDLLCAEHCSHCDLSKDGHALLPQCPGVLSVGAGSASQERDVGGDTRPCMQEGSALGV